MVEFIRYSRGRRTTDNRPEQRTAADFAEFREAVLADQSAAKGLTYVCGPLSKGLHDDQQKHPGEAHWRLKNRALPRRFLPLDFDLIVDAEALLDLVQWAHRRSGLGYTTASHTDDKPRFRAIFELSREATRDECIHLGRAIGQQIEADLGLGRFGLDKSVYQIEQACYTPTEGADQYRFDGEPIDVDGLMEAYPEAQADAAPRAAPQGAGDLLATLEAGDDVHGALLRLVGQWVQKRMSDKEIRMLAGAALTEVASVRGSDRVEQVFATGELQRMIDGARAKGFAPRTFDEILGDCQSLTAEATPREIELLVLEAAALSTIEERRCHEAIKQKTGIPLGALKAAGKTQHTEEGPDHRDIALSLISAVGANNLIADAAFLWRYRGDGVWKPTEARGEKSLVQGHTAAAFPDVPITSGVITSVAELTKNEQYRLGHEWNTGPTDCVVTPNGEVALTGECFDWQWSLQPHCREHYRTSSIPVEFNPGATAPAFEQFLADIFEPDDDGPDKARALLEVMGYSLMSHCRFERFVILVGAGANGKSVFLRVLEALIGRENIAGVQPEEFANRFQRAHLHNRLANLVSEIREGEQIDDAALKAIVSGEQMTVEHKFRDPFELRPFATCWFATNHLPHTRDFSDATFRRALVVPFNRKFTPGVDADPNLAGKLITELPGILNLALEAFKAVAGGGAFTNPPSCEQAKAEWRLEADQAAQFVEDRCAKRGTGAVRSSALFDAYRQWAVDNGVGRTLSHKGFSGRLERLGFAKQRRNTGAYFLGIGLRSEFEQEDGIAAAAEAYRRASGW